MSSVLEFFSYLLTFFCVILAIVVYYKGYNLSTCIEYLLLAVAIYIKFKVTFSTFISLKVLISFLMFIAETIYYFKNIKKFKKLTYFMKGSINSCHAVIGVRNEAYDYSTGMFFAPCVGFCLPIINEEVLTERLNQCAKCHDWGTVSIYLLSCHKYLSYSCIIHLRWLTWLAAGSSVVLKISEKFILQIVQPKAINQAKMLFQILCTFLHMLLVIFDIMNLKEERLEDNADIVKKSFFIRGLWFDLVKLMMLIVSTYCCHLFAPSIVIEYDFLLYLLICFLVGQLVDRIVSLRIES